MAARLKKSSNLLRPLRHSLRLVGWICVFAAGSAQSQGVAVRGFEIMASPSQGNCHACHALPGNTGFTSTFGPSLLMVGQRYNASVLRQWVTDARQVKPDTLMPPFGTTMGTQDPVRASSVLTGQDIEHVVAALASLR